MACTKWPAVQWFRVKVQIIGSDGVWPAKGLHKVAGVLERDDRAARPATSVTRDA